MGNSAYIKLVSASKQQEVTLENVKELFKYYKNLTIKTGQQLNWEYNEAAFPYELLEKEEAGNQWFYLKSKEKRYNYIVLGIGKEIIQVDGDNREQYFIQIVLPEGSTYGDRGKANEFAKFIAKELDGELHLFNERIMYFYKR